MKKLKAVLTDNSAFRRAYIICLFLFNVTPIMVFDVFVLAAVFVWGVFLLIYNEITRRTISKTRFGFWLALFIVSSALTALLNINPNFLYNVHNIVMVFHAAICFFIFYSIHTEKELNFRRELYSICRFIVYTTTVLGILGLACLMADIKFEILGLKFIVYENRFTGLFSNPNQLGFYAVAAIFCSHMLLKKDFIAISGRERVSSIWIASCVAVNAISLILSDSNGALVLLICYGIFFLIYKMFGSERKLSLKQIITKSLAALLAGVVIVAALFFVRNVTQEGFSTVMNGRDAVVVIEGDLDINEGIVTFEHENKNIDSGRFKLWSQGLQMFLKNPVMGIGKGNIFDYGNSMFENGVKFSDKYGLLAPLMTDFHNGYITIMVCSGAIGLILFVIFGVRFFIGLTRHVFRDDSLKESTLPCMYAFLCAYVIYAFIEEAMLFNLLFMVVFFWMILGYASCFLVSYEPDETKGTFTFFGKSFSKTLL